MSGLIRNGAVATDAYVPVGDDEPLPAGSPVLVTLARWLKERDAIAARELDFGVRLPNTTEITTLDPAILAAPLIVLEFPGFSDGRAYSQARLLRDAKAYRGELRATGAAVVRDQLPGMSRCGINSFYLRADQSLDDGVAALTDHSIAYQPAVDQLPQVRRLRRLGAGA